MTLRLDLPPDVETTLRTRAAAAGLDVAAFVAEVVAERLSEADSEAEPPRANGRRSRRAFAERLQAWTDLHPRHDTPVVDDRESIYAGRGE